LLLQLSNQSRFTQQTIGILAIHLGKKLIQKVIGKWALRLALPGLVGIGVVGQSFLLELR
jgi:hypothetical protein